MFKKALLSLIVGSIMPLARADTKAAFDLGSGKFRVLVADVEGKDIEIKYSSSRDVGLGADLLKSSDQTLSDEIQSDALNALKELKRQAQALGATDFQGVATAAFRLAKNGDAFLKLLKQETEIDLQIISQEEEGILGFRTAMAFFPNLDDKKLIAWDCGAASFQLVAKNKSGYQVYEGDLGNSHLAKIFLEEVRKGNTAPVTMLECEHFIRIIQSKIDPSDWLIAKLSEKDTTLVALRETGIFTLFDEDVSYLKEDIKKMTETFLKRPNLDMALLQSICFIYAVMDKCDRKTIVFKRRISGNALGLLSAELAESI